MFSNCNFVEVMEVLLGHDFAKLSWAPKMIPKALLSVNPGHFLPETCLIKFLLINFFLNQVTMCDHPKITHQDICPALRSLTREAFMTCERKEELFRNNIWVYSAKEEAGCIRLTSRFSSGSDYLDLQPASGTVYTKAIKMIWVLHRIIKIQYKTDVFIFYEVLLGVGEEK